MTRGVVLKGWRPDVEVGRRVAVRGVVRVIAHPGGFVDGVFVPGWTEIRVQE